MNECMNKNSDILVLGVLEYTRISTFLLRRLPKIYSKWKKKSKIIIRTRRNYHRRDSFQHHVANKHQKKFLLSITFIIILYSIHIHYVKPEICCKNRMKLWIKLEMFLSLLHLVFWLKCRTHYIITGKTRTVTPSIALKNNITTTIISNSSSD